MNKNNNWILFIYIRFLPSVPSFFKDLLSLSLGGSSRSFLMTLALVRCCCWVVREPRSSVRSASIEGEVPGDIAGSFVHWKETKTDYLKKKNLLCTRHNKELHNELGVLRNRLLLHMSKCSSLVSFRASEYQRHLQTQLTSRNLYRFWGIIYSWCFKKGGGINSTVFF